MKRTHSATEKNTTYLLMQGQTASRGKSTDGRVGARAKPENSYGGVSFRSQITGLSKSQGPFTVTVHGMWTSRLQDQVSQASFPESTKSQPQFDFINHTSFFHSNLLRRNLIPCDFETRTPHLPHYSITCIRIQMRGSIVGVLQRHLENKNI